MLSGCSEVRKVTDAIIKPTAREVYARELKDQPEALNDWQNAYQLALRDSLEINLPYGEKGNFIGTKNTSYSYNFTLEKGKKINVEVAGDTVNQLVFIDLFILKDGKFVLEKSNEKETAILEFIPKESGTFKLVVQPELYAKRDFFLKLDVNPVYGFPVAGKENAAIQSFWGNERDAGKRQHEGIDIFASKGTPVVAVSDGSISSTRNQGIGGKQVWLRTSLMGNSLYYAHLDSVAVQDGDKVKTGDTLGFVGNTGNAKFTPPHLHFGIYQGYGGAVNPLPFVFKTEALKGSQFPKKYKTSQTRIVSQKALVRKGPSTAYAKIGELKAGDSLFILGQSKEWLHILMPQSKKGFLHSSLVK